MDLPMLHTEPTIFVDMLLLFLGILHLFTLSACSLLLLTPFLSQVRFNETGILNHSFLHLITLNVQLPLQLIPDLFINTRFFESISDFPDRGEIWYSLWESQEIMETQPIMTLEL